MLSKHQISKVVRQVYPTRMFPFIEQRQLRKLLFEDIKNYLDEYPNTSYDELIAHYVDSPQTAFDNRGQLYIKSHICVLMVIALIIILLCVILYAISNNFTPPTYYFNYYKFEISRDSVLIIRQNLYHTFIISCLSIISSL